MYLQSGKNARITFFQMEPGSKKKVDVYYFQRRKSGRVGAQNVFFILLWMPSALLAFEPGTDFFPLLYTMTTIASDIYTASKWGQTALLQTIFEASDDLRTDVNTIMQNGATALHVAISNDHADVVRLLLEKGARVATASGAPPLHVASQYGRAGVVEFLLGKRLRRILPSASTKAAVKVIRPSDATKLGASPSPCVRHCPAPIASRTKVAAVRTCASHVAVKKNDLLRVCFKKSCVRIARRRISRETGRLLLPISRCTARLYFRYCPEMPSFDVRPRTSTPTSLKHCFDSYLFRSAEHTPSCFLQKYIQTPAAGLMVMHLPCGKLCVHM